MSYILVTADLPDVSTDQRKAIYKCLEEKKWNKITEFGRDVSTAWYASFGESTSEKDAIATTINEFVACSQPYCKPKLVIHWGPNKPTFHGLN